MPDPPPSASGTARPTVAATGVRSCDTSVEVPLTADPAAVVVGPLGVQSLDYRFGVQGDLNAQADAQGWWRFKIPVAIEGNESVTISVPAEFRGIAKLTYVAGRGDYATTFVPCDTRRLTHFAGGVAIREAVCLPLAVSWSGHTEQLRLAFGEGACGPR